MCFCNTRTQCAFVFHVSSDKFFFFEKMFFLAHIREVGNTFLFFLSSAGGTESSHHGGMANMCVRARVQTLLMEFPLMYGLTVLIMPSGRNKATCREYNGRFNR